MLDNVSEYNIKSTVVNGTDIGIQADHNGKKVGQAYSYESKIDTKKKGKTVVRSRVDVDPEFQGKGVGKELVQALFGLLKQEGLYHQEGFSDMGEERLRKLYEQTGYTEVSPGIWEKDYE